MAAPFQAMGGTIPRSNHVVVIVEENHGYSSVVGNSSMPYLNSLIKKGGLATNYYANTHPSIGNYFEMTAGQMVTNNDSYTGTVSVNNLVRQMITSGHTWKAYLESLPAKGYTGGNHGAFLARHAPLTYFEDVRNSGSERLNLVSFPQLKTDLANNALPNFSFVAPNIYNDGHNGSLNTADSWLKANVPAILADAGFKQDGILIIVFDEASDSDRAHGGGHVAAVVVGPKVKPGTRSTQFHQHQSLLKTVEMALGLPVIGDAANKSTISMKDLFY